LAVYINEDPTSTCCLITGIDLQSFAGEVMSEDADVGRKAFHLQKIVAKFQDSFTVLEKVVARSFMSV